MIHELKIDHEFFIPILEDIKTFEIRKNDRNYKKGDIIILKELNEDKASFTGRYIKAKITYISDYQQKDNYVVFSFEKEF
ncbi:TPA: DUF3850 domain-containing protein [Clostridioides difficile]|nr:DUF3850 domain-containing protein [Clostridioides difficile]